MAYTHAGGIDAPLDIIRMGYTPTNQASDTVDYHWGAWGGPYAIVPHTNARGAFDGGTTAFGHQLPCSLPSSSCTVVAWPGANYRAFYTTSSPVSQQTWYGSLIDKMTDASGLMYMRNRYYNPQTGAFTQRDPIGIAGGLNVYGFASGDPVSYSDPYGLCPGANGEDDGTPCEFGDVRQAHGFWLNMAREGMQQGGAGGALKVAAGIGASTVLDYGGATTMDESARTVADPHASATSKAVAVGSVAFVLSNYVGLGAANRVARAVRSGALQEIGLATRLVGNTAYRGSRIYGLRNTAGRTAGTDKYGFYFSIDNAGHILHIGKWKW